MALASLFMALDGINEKGLAIAVLDAGDKVVTKQDTPKPDLTTTSAVQYLLKNAANVKEALELLRGIDMNSDPGSAYHLSMADTTGRSVAVEYVDNKMVVTESPFVTNHYLCKEKFEVGLHESDNRHEKLMEQYQKTGEDETGCAYHVCHISTKESVSIIRDAKKSGVDVTCETAPHYLLLDDSMLKEDGKWKI